MPPSQMFVQVLGGLSLFLLGMKYMSEGIQTTAGKKLRAMVSAVTDNRLMGCLTGIAVTSLIQSSAITTVMLVGLVNASVMTLQQAFGVILGANIGTTVTAWIVSLDVLGWGLPIMAVASFAYIFGKTDKVKFIGMVVMGVGMVFFGLDTMKDGIAPLRESEGFRAFLSHFQPVGVLGVCKCALVGALVTAVLQSSSATVAITLALAQSQVISFETAVALVLGENIGTTVTALIASLGATTAAKRVALAHILSKTVGVIALVFLFPLYLRLLVVFRDALGLTDDVGKGIALAHTLFNVALVALFLAFTGPFTRLVCRLMPAKGEDGETHITYLDVRMLATPAFGIQQSFQEILRMADRAQTMLNDLRACVIDPEAGDPETRGRIVAGEKMLDDQQREVVQFLARLVRGQVTREMNGEIRRQIRLADEYESISDYVNNILTMLLRREEGGYHFSEQATSELLRIHDAVTDFVASITHDIRKGDSSPAMLHRVHVAGSGITRLYKQFQQEHMNRIVSGACEPVPGLIYADAMNAYRKIQSHGLNAAEALAGEK